MPKAYAPSTSIMYINPLKIISIWFINSVCKLNLQIDNTYKKITSINAGTSTFGSNTLTNQSNILIYVNLLLLFILIL